VRFVAPYLGGLLFERFGFQAPLLANWAGLVVALLVIQLAVDESAHGNALVTAGEAQ
jgi:hypothetical protein